LSIRAPAWVAWIAAALTAGVAAHAAGDGAAVFAQNCQLCHQSGAVGLAGAFPRLAGRLAPISAKPAGRIYLIHVLTFGMAGSVTVDKQPLIGVMPPFASLPPEDVAAVLSYVQTLGSAPASMPAPFTAAEVAAERAKASMAAADVLAERRGLEKSKLIQ
jgi:mono/diheme cytochrome c family protein